MQKLNTTKIANVAAKTVHVAKIVAIATLTVTIIALSVTGGYVLLNADLRNNAIDTAQGQGLPKE